MKNYSDGLKPLQTLAYLHDMSALTALLRFELHPHPRVLQRSRPLNLSGRLNAVCRPLQGLFLMNEQFFNAFLA
nr:hypothetical protein [Neisseria dumasiana]